MDTPTCRRGHALTSDNVYRYKGDQAMRDAADEGEWPEVGA